MKKIENLFQQRVRSKLKNQEIHKKFVHNSSQRILTERKSFIPAIKLHNTSQNIPYEKYFLATELACQKIEDQGKKSELSVL